MTIDARINYFVKGAATQNLGDYLPVLMASRALLQPRVEADIYRLIGSVIEADWILRDLRHSVGSPRGHVAFWGCGMRAARPLPAAVQAQCSFFGVRGPLTRDVLGLPEDTPLGDPALLLPLMHDASRPSDTLHRSICIPHIHDPKTDAELLALSGAQCVVRPSIPSTQESLAGIIDRIAQADFVLTGSLHGALVACAYGRPFAFWDNGHVDLDFKWRDLAASVGIPCEFVRDLTQGRAMYADAIVPSLRLPPLTPMLDACPFAVRPHLLLRALVADGHVVGDASIDAAVRALGALPSLQPAVCQTLYETSARWRAQRMRVADVAVRRAGSLRERVKKSIREVLWQRWGIA